VLLAIEVADRSLHYDLTVKVPLYASYGIPETWVWDVLHQQVHVFRNPVGGRYQEQFIARPGDMLELVALPGVRVPVAEVFSGRPAPEPG
jgi:Uma2 family endonuclease